MTGAVYDRGYRPYEGARGGRSAARAALFRASVRRALGLRREWRQKIAPFVLLAIGVVPAIVNVGVKYLTRDTQAREIEFITYRGYVGVSNALLVFVALTAPDIMCPDRRQRVLPLVFARPITGVDYVIAKVGSMAAIVFAFSFIPQVVLFVGQMLVTKDGALRYLRDNAEVLWQVPFAVAVLAIYYASIGVAIASLTGRRIIAGTTIIGLFLVTSIVSSIMVGETYPRYNDGSLGALLNLATLPLHVRDVIFLGRVDHTGTLGGVANGGLYAALALLAVVAVALATLVRRYDEVER
ncbi:MAG: ABC transporter permease [Microthrixaceae bacterium]